MWPTLRLEGEGVNSASIVAENYRQFGKLPVLLARRNPDLAMGEELLKNTGAGNLFMVFGEPDVTISRSPRPPGEGSGVRGARSAYRSRGLMSTTRPPE